VTFAGFLLSLSVMMPPQAAVPPATRATDTIPVFPAVSGNSLMKRKFSLPADFEGELNVVLIAFKRNQQDDVDTWTPHLRALAANHPGLKVYELPVLPRSITIMRGFIDGGMRSGIPDTAVRATTITLYINKTPFKKSLDIRSEEHIEVVLVDRKGVIHWRAQGLFDEAALTTLEQALATVMRREPHRP
jgi:hypothetical protein